MKPVKCANNHFFDLDKYQKCPQCGAEIAGGNPQPAAASPMKKTTTTKGNNVATRVPSAAQSTFGIFGRNKKKGEATRPEVVDTNKPKTMEPKASSIDSIKSHTSASNSQYISGFPNKVLEPANTAPAPAPVQQAPVQQPVQQIPVQQAPVAESPRVESIPVSTPAPASAPISEPQGSSLMSEIKKVSNDNEGKTVGFFNSGKSSASNNDSAAPQALEEPVVGWLVCTKGPHFGESFVIVAGRNSVGRNSTNKICINKDNSVSREKHAWIIYEPKKRKFFAQPGESSGLVYVNDDNIMQSTELKAGDVLELGSVCLRLVPLCGEDFSWEDFQE